MSVSSINQQDQERNLRNFYKFQARIYDATRWISLFGRKEAMRAIDLPKDAPLQILEVGPGTGYNSKWLLDHFPQAKLTAFELSADMIRQIHKKTRNMQDRIEVYHEPYGARQGEFAEKFDLVVFSYCLSMVNPQWEDLLQQAHKDLKPGSHIMVVDFHDSGKTWFRKYMSRHHTRVEGQLLPGLQKLFTDKKVKVGKCYGNTWEYFYYFGERAR